MAAAPAVEAVCFTGGGQSKHALRPPPGGEDPKRNRWTTAQAHTSPGGTARSRVPFSSTLEKSPEWESPEWESPEWESPEWEIPEWEIPEWESPTELADWREAYGNRADEQQSGDRKGCKLCRTLRASSAFLMAAAALRVALQAVTKPSFSYPDATLVSEVGLPLLPYLWENWSPLRTVREMAFQAAWRGAAGGPVQASPPLTPVWLQIRKYPIPQCHKDMIDLLYCIRAPSTSERIPIGPYIEHEEQSLAGVMIPLLLNTTLSEVTVQEQDNTYLTFN
ncbi:hypothetical protein NFI96_007275, partial [Prochilodus magdalenae]